MFPILSAVGLSKHPPYSKTFKEGTRTLPLLAGFILPDCWISLQSGAYVELYNENTGFVAAKLLNFGSYGTEDTGLKWNFGSYPVLKKTFSGVYRCRTDTAKSKDFYNLTVVGKGRWRIECVWDFLCVLFLNLYTCLC